MIKREENSNLIKPRRIGIMGGTFDPVHLGHMDVAEAAIEEVGLEEVWMMPAYIQPFKQDRIIADARDRIKMLELAVEQSRHIKISSWEIDKEIVSYTFDTIKGLLEENCIDDIFFLLGSDALMKVESWYKGKEILNMCGFIVGLRSTENRTSLEVYAKHLKDSYGTEIILLEREMRPISSTTIRSLVSEGKSLSGLVSRAVEEYIYANELYT